MAFERYDCTVCDETFAAYPDANATDGPYCTPNCETDAKGL